MKRDWLFPMIWGAWALFVFTTELLATGWHGWTRPVAIGWFLFFEVFGILRAEKGDTLSEQVWRFYGNRPARIPLVLGMSGFFGLALAEVGTEYVVMYGPIPAARLCLLLGVVGWLLPHLLARGRWG